MARNVSVTADEFLGKSSALVNPHDIMSENFAPDNDPPYKINQIHTVTGEQSQIDM
jgi:hypothetical protein